jgi:hypothetical protein
VSASEPKKWSVMVYMAGDNNLSPEMVWGLQEMNEYFTNRNPDNVVLTAQFDGMGAYPRRYRFRPGGPHPLPGESDGWLREYRNQVPPGSSSTPANEDVIDEGALRDQELDSIGRIALDKAGSDAAVDLPSVREFRKLPTIVQTGPASSLADSFPVPPHVTPTSAAIQPSIAKKLKKSVDFLLADVAANAQLQDFVIRLTDEHEPTAAGGGLPESADFRAVILSGHGNGSFGDFLPDEDPNSSLSIPDIGTFIRLLRRHLRVRAGGAEGGRSEIHILGMDSCLMSTLEVCYEVREDALFLVGTEGFAPLSGWPYQRVLEALQDDWTATIREIVGRYCRYYRDYEDSGTSTDIAAIDLREIKTVADCLEQLIRKVMGYLGELMGWLPSPRTPESEQFSMERQPLDELVELGRHPTPPENYNPQRGREVRNALVLARWYAQSYMGEQQVDIWDFCDQLCRFLPSESEYDDLRTKCREVKEAVDAAVFTNAWTGTDFQHSHGLSVYFPCSADDFAPEYFDEHLDERGKTVEQGLVFARETKWGWFLREFLRLTRRVRRDQESHMKDDADFRSFRRQGLLEDPLDMQAYSNYRVRSGGLFNVRSGGPLNTRSGGPLNTRSGGPLNTRSGGPLNTKGAWTGTSSEPDGFYPREPCGYGKREG